MYLNDQRQCARAYEDRIEANAEEAHLCRMLHGEDPTCPPETKSQDIIAIRRFVPRYCVNITLHYHSK